MQQSGRVPLASSTKVVPVEDGDLLAAEEDRQPPASGMSAKEDSTMTTPDTVTAESTDDDSTKTLAESQEHKQRLNPHSETASSQAKAPAPSQATAHSEAMHESAPAPGPMRAEALNQSTTAVPAPAPTDAR